MKHHQTKKTNAWLCSLWSRCWGDLAPSLPSVSVCKAVLGTNQCTHTSCCWPPLMQWHVSKMPFTKSHPILYGSHHLALLGNLGVRATISFSCVYNKIYQSVGQLFSGNCATYESESQFMKRRNLCDQWTQSLVDSLSLGWSSFSF